MSAPELFDGVLQTVVGTFGVPATVRLVGEVPVALTAVFDESHLLVTLENGIDVSTTGPAALVKLADLPRAPRRGDHLDVAGKSFAVRDAQADGQGGSLLLLEASP